MFGKVDIRDILRDHFRTLVSYDSKRPHVGDYILFYVVPLAAVAVAVWRHFVLSEGAVGVLMGAVAILAGLLFNLLVLIHGFSRTTGPTTPEDGKQLLSETYANIAYATLVALLSLVPLSYLANGHGPWTRIANGLSLYLLLHLGLTLLLILKRIHALISHELKAPR